MSEQDRIAFEKWYKKMYPKIDSLVHKNGELGCWSAATAEANKRIEALEGEVAELKFSIKCLVEKLSEERKKFSEDKKEWSINAQRFIEGDPKLKQQISELQASNNDLREALEASKEKLKLHLSGSREYLGGMPTQFLFPMIEKALSATPAESLQAHDDMKGK